MTKIFCTITVFFFANLSFYDDLIFFLYNTKTYSDKPSLSKLFQNFEMMKIYLHFISFILWYYFAECLQPFFPSQIVFSPDDGTTTIAIDEINQRAYKMLTYGSTRREISYVEKNFSYAPVDSPQSKNYVQLTTDSPPLSCMYGTYWKYGRNNFNSFPSHWLNGTSFKIKNYLNFSYEMLHSKDPSGNDDYWYSNVTCRLDSGESVPCEEIYFKKNTDIPLRFVQVIRRGSNTVQVTTNYQVIAMGKPDEKYFDSIPKNWFVACQDFNLGLLYNPVFTKINLKQSSKIHISLTAPPHRINGNDTVIIRWESTECSDCVRWTPKELTFNTKNFQEKQILTITRVEDGQQTSLAPIFHGGGFNRVPPQTNSIFIE